VTADRLALVTGTSTGIGAAVARELLQRGWHVVGVARRMPPLDSPTYRHLSLDLADVPTASAAIEREFGAVLAECAWDRVGLVNNAAIAPGGRARSLDAAELLRAFALNTVMPVWLIGFLLKHRPQGVPDRIANLSSGAALHPIPGLVAYCSSKAALRMAGMVIAAEDDDDLAILSYGPGTVDTEMQLAARSAPLDEFPSAPMFRQFHAEGRLVAPEVPAADIAAFLEADNADRFVETRRG
jgi:NAD(P)-dependent dehydrogenase (short-subunit alcohol dehydrogenase family)